MIQRMGRWCALSIMCICRRTMELPLVSEVEGDSVEVVFGDVDDTYCGEEADEIGGSEAEERIVIHQHRLR